jgi:hypothetical protein
MGIGELKVGGGANALLEAEFVYSIPEWQPKVKYRVEEGRGKLRVRQPETGWHFGEPVKYTWDLRFNNEVPLDLHLRLGSGKAHLDLSGLNLTKLTGLVGSGSLDANLSGEMSGLKEVDLNTASGRTHLMMDGTYAELEDISLGTASGKLDLVLAGEYPALTSLALKSASGKMDLSLTGRYAVLENVTIESASGRLEVDMTGAWQHNLDVGIHLVSGTVKLRLPSTIGVDVNEAYGKSEVTLRVDISTVSGKVVLQVGGD